MPKYKFFYKREIEARDVKAAIAKERQVKLLFESVVQVEEPKDKKIIGFKA